VTEHHAAGPASTGRVPVRRAALVIFFATAIGVGAGVALHELGSTASPPAAAGRLPSLHGQAVWSSGERPAPALALRDQRGTLVSLPTLRRRPVLLTFLDSRCKLECPIQGRELASILRRLPVAERPALVVVSVDPAGDTAASIKRATAEWGLAGAWTWHWLNGTPAQLKSVWRAYGITVDPSSGDIVHSLVLYLIDRGGYERTAYLYPFLPGFVQGDLGKLAREHA
jgi:protein SCO1/2